MTLDERAVTSWANRDYRSYALFRDQHPLWQTQDVLVCDRDYPEWIRAAAQEARQRGYE